MSADESAFPESVAISPAGGVFNSGHRGLTKREFFAVTVMGGFMSDARNLTSLIDAKPEALSILHTVVAREAVAFADALCKALKLDETREAQLLERIAKLEKDLAERNGHDRP